MLSGVRETPVPLTLIRVRNADWPSPIERASASDRRWTSWPASPSSASPLASVSTVTPGATHGSSGVAFWGGTGVTGGLFGPSPEAFTAETAYVYVVPLVSA